VLLKDVKVISVSTVMYQSFRRGNRISQGRAMNKAVNVVTKMEEEVVVLCPKCKTFETVWLTNGVIVKTQKFTQEDDRIFHDCGSDEPCRLLRRFSY